MQAHSHTDILVFVQDPGAVNYAVPLITEMRSKGWAVKVLSTGIAQEQLSLRGIAHEVVTEGLSATAVLNACHPRLLLVGTACNPDTFAFPLIQASRKLGIQSIGFIDAAMNPEKRFSGRTDNPLYHAPDLILVPDVQVQQLFLALGALPEQVLVCGHPHHDYVRSLGRQFRAQGRQQMRLRLFPHLRPDQKVVMFISEASSRLDPLIPEIRRDLTFTGRGGANGRSEIILEELLDALDTREDRPYIVLRAHPKDSPDDYDCYRHELDLVSCGGTPHELLYAADLVVGMTSMSILETLLMGRLPLAVIPRSAEAQWLPYHWQQQIPCVSNRHDFRRALEQRLPDSENDIQSSGDVSESPVNDILTLFSNLMDNGHG
jgi:hypothetical protein